MLGRYLSLSLSLLLIFLAIPTNAVVKVGAGFNSATGGRLIPSLNLGLGGESFTVLSSSTGVATRAYSHSAYSLSAYWTKKSGDFLGGSITSGFGIGSFYENRTFKDSTSAEEIKNDFALGPALFAQWTIWGPIFISVEGIFGLPSSLSTGGDLLGLNFRDHINFIFGVEL